MKSQGKADGKLGSAFSDRDVNTGFIRADVHAPVPESKDLVVSILADVPELESKYYTLLGTGQETSPDRNRYPIRSRTPSRQATPSPPKTLSSPLTLSKRQSKINSTGPGPSDPVESYKMPKSKRQNFINKEEFEELS